MLVITRTVGEKFVINNNITIAVLKINDSNVRIGIDAPLSVIVERQEIVGKFDHKTRVKG
jgi:carbon storage regulator